MRLAWYDENRLGVVRGDRVIFAISLEYCDSLSLWNELVIIR